jgi:hypothetical protein
MEFIDGGALTDVIFANENLLTEAHIAFVCHKVFGFFGVFILIFHFSFFVFLTIYFL